MTFASAITCIDGRALQPVVDYLKQKHAVDVVDVVTAPGVNRILAEDSSSVQGELVKGHAALSISAHQSRLIAVAGHHDCAANPGDDKQQQGQIKEAVRAVEAWNLGAKVVGLWVDHSWSVFEI